MQQYSNTFMTNLGRPVRPEDGARIEVYTYPGNVLAVLYSDNGVTPKSNPITTDANGLFEFYAADGRYSLVLTSDVTSDVTLTDAVLLEDPADNTAAQISFTAAGTGSVTRIAQDKMRERRSVEDKGAVGDGVTSSSTAFSNSYSNAVANDTINVGPGNFVTGSVSGSKVVLWQCDGSLNAAGNAPLDLPGIVETMFERRKLIRQTQSTATDYAAVQVQRTANHTGGTPGFVNTGFRVDTTVSSGVTNFEWALVGVVNNYADAGENNGIYGQGNQYSTGATWAATFEARDHRNASNTVGSLVGIEVDLFANGTDGNNNRVAIDAVIGKGTAGGSQCEAAYGIRVTPTNNDFSAGRVKRAFSVAIDTDCAYDASQATMSSGGVAFRMAINQKFSLTANNDRTFGYDSSGFRYFVSGTAKWSISDTGETNQSGGLKISGTQVLTSRRTGFTNQMSGTADSANAYDTETITLLQLARRVKALQDAITTHGLIGP